MIRVYTDGAYSAKDGIGGWAWILVRDGKAICGDLGRSRPRGAGDCTTNGSTNNRMEMIAVGAGLAWVPDWLDVTVVSDSAYVVNCFLEGWYEKWRTNGWITSNKQPVQNRDIWERLLAVVEGRQGPTRWQHVKGHNGDRWNEVCDRLAVYARTATNQPTGGS